jgi:hypothetical protein
VVKWNMFKEVEKRMHYKFWDKERERSNRAAGKRDTGITMPLCVMRHKTIAWSGPPHDQIQAYICLHCNGAACEPEVKDRGYDFATVPLFAIHAIMDDDVKRQRDGNPHSYSMGGVSPLVGDNAGMSGANSWTGT